MRTLGEIINVCKDGGRPTIDEARFAICVMDALMVFDSIFHTRRAGREIAGKKPDLFSAEHDHAERFNRVKSAMSKTPMEWLGSANDPDSAEVQKRRKISNGIFNKVCSRR